MYGKIKVLFSIALIALVLAGTGLLFSAWADHTFAAGITLIGNAKGLKLEPEGPLFTEENMAPGDEATATVTVINEGNKPFTLTVSAKKISGDLLFEGLQVSVTDQDSGTVYYSGSMGEMNGTNAAQIGNIPAKGTKDLVLTVLFLREADNDYQGAALNMSWVFNATWPTGGGGGGGGGGGDYYYYEPESPAVTPAGTQELTPEAPAGLPEGELVIKPESPAVMPKTGVGVPYPYYALGGLAILFGTLLLRKPKRYRSTR